MMILLSLITASVKAVPLLGLGLFLIRLSSKQRVHPRVHAAEMQEKNAQQQLESYLKRYHIHRTHS